MFWILQAVLVTGISAAPVKGYAPVPEALTPHQEVTTQDAPPEGTNSRDTDKSKLPLHLDRRDRIFYPGDTERPKPLLRKLFLNIVYDQEEIFTSPFHINRNDALEWLIPTAWTGGLIAADTHIANAFENSRGQVRWGGRISNIGASYTLLPIVAGSYVFGAWKDNAKAREIGVLGTESLVDSLIVAGVFKEAFRRNRPDEKHPGVFWGGGTSFPSGHAIEVVDCVSIGPRVQEQKDCRHHCLHACGDRQRIAYRGSETFRFRCLRRRYNGMVHWTVCLRYAYEPSGP